VGPRNQRIHFDHSTDLNEKFSFTTMTHSGSALDGTAYKNAGRMYPAPPGVLI
jgi:hypothetical protein